MTSREVDDLMSDDGVSIHVCCDMAYELGYKGEWSVDDMGSDCCRSAYELGRGQRIVDDEERGH